MTFSGNADPCKDAHGDPEPDGNYEDPDDCRKFYMCSGGIAFNMGCAAGTIYNPASRNCNIHDDGRQC